MSWVAVAVVGGSVIAGAMSSSAQADQQKTQNQYSQQDQELNFQRQAWLAQQQRAWQLQDRQYKQAAIHNFSKFGVQSGITPPNQNAELSQLDQFDPNKLGSVGKTNYGSAAPSAPLQQLSPGGAPIGRPNRVLSPDEMQ